MSQAGAFSSSSSGSARTDTGTDRMFDRGKVRHEQASAHRKELLFQTAGTRANLLLSASNAANRRPSPVLLRSSPSLFCLFPECSSSRLSHRICGSFSLVSLSLFSFPLSPLLPPLATRLLKRLLSSSAFSPFLIGSGCCLPPALALRGSAFSCRTSF